MGVMIEPIPDSVRLRITGDVETVLSVPYDDDDRFLIGLSDGTLLVGFYDEELHCQFDVARDGAGMVRFEHGRACVDFDIEWTTVSAYNPDIVELQAPAALPLFPDMEAGNKCGAMIPW